MLRARLRSLWWLLSGLILLGMAPVSQADLIKLNRRGHLGTQGTSISIWTSDLALGEIALLAAQTELARLDARFSARRPGSEVTRLNAYAGSQAVHVDREVMGLLQWGRLVHDRTDGAFNLTAAGLKWQYGFGSGQPRVPTQVQLNPLIPLADDRLIVLDPKEGTVLFKRAGAQLDVDELLKGYALDRLKRKLREENVDAAWIAVGQSVTTLGVRPDGQAWNYRFRDPRAHTRVLARLPLPAGKIVVAAEDEACFELEGERYHGFIDHLTGRPSAFARAAALFLPERPALELPAAALLILPTDLALQAVAAIPGAEAVLLDAEGKLQATRGWQKYLAERP